MGNFKDYLDFITENGDFPNSVLIFAEIYLKNSISDDRTLKLIKPEGVKALYGVCIFLAYKFLLEHDYWPIKEFCNFIGVDKLTMFKYEIFVIDKMLGYKLNVNTKDYYKECTLLQKLGASKQD
jgi:hypothetical protein